MLSCSLSDSRRPRPLQRRAAPQRGCVQRTSAPPDVGRSGPRAASSGHKCRICVSSQGGGAELSGVFCPHLPKAPPTGPWPGALGFLGMGGHEHAHRSRSPCRAAGDCQHREAEPCSVGSLPSGPFWSPTRLESCLPRSPACAGTGIDGERNQGTDCTPRQGS